MRPSAWKVSAVRFLTAKGEMRSSPAMTQMKEEWPTVRPTEGKRRGRREEGSWEMSLDKGLQRMRVLRPGVVEMKQRRPPEEAAGEKLGGIREEKERWCHVLSLVLRRKAVERVVGVVVVVVVVGVGMLVEGKKRNQ